MRTITVNVNNTTPDMVSVKQGEQVKIVWVLNENLAWNGTGILITPPKSTDGSTTWRWGTPHETSGRYEISYTNDLTGPTRQWKYKVNISSTSERAGRGEGADPVIQNEGGGGPPPRPGFDPDRD